MRKKAFRFYEPVAVVLLVLLSMLSGYVLWKAWDPEVISAPSVPIGVDIVDKWGAR